MTPSSESCTDTPSHNRAAALFQQYGATLYLRQVLAKKEILKA